MELKVERKFKEVFGWGGRKILTSAPGRVNLIGEHTDYNFGFVLPLAINLRTYVLARRRDDFLVRVYSVNMNDIVEANLGNLEPKGWSAYILGAGYILKKEGYNVKGADILVWGEVPFGGGLSSSASVEVAVLKAWASLFEIEIKPMDVAILARKAENEFAGVPCGIMDQMASVFGTEGYALFIDCQSLDFERVPIPESWKIVICDTGVKHTLGQSEYSKRQKECGEGVEAVRRSHPEVQSLRDVKLVWLDEAKGFMSEVAYKRCNYVLKENERVIKAREALERKDALVISKLFRESHKGLRDEYEVSCFELDVLVEIAYNLGCIGARMTGAGFGGNTVNLVEEGRVDEFVRRVKKEYKDKTGKDVKIRILKADKGVVIH